MGEGGRGGEVEVATAAEVAAGGSALEGEEVRPAPDPALTSYSRESMAAASAPGVRGTPTEEPAAGGDGGRAALACSSEHD